MMVELQEALPQGWDNPPVPEQDLSLCIKVMPREVDNTRGPTPSLSHHAPNIQTSLAVVKRRKLMDSGDIHLMGRRVTDAGGRDGWWLCPLQWGRSSSSTGWARQRGLTTVAAPAPSHHPVPLLQEPSGSAGQRNPCSDRTGLERAPAPSHSSYLYSTPHPRCTWRARSLPASRTLGRPPGRS